MKRTSTQPAVWRTRASWRTRAALAVWLASCAAGAAAQALISPVVVEFGPKQKIATVRVSLSEQAIKPMRLQTQLLQWRQDVHGAAVTQPSDDLIVTPRISELKPGQQQVLRVALRGALPADTERAYRLVLEDIAEPSSVELAGGAAVNFRMAYDLPVMVAPRGAFVTALRWRSCPVGADAPVSKGVCVRILNTGNRRLKVQAVMLAGQGWQRSLDLKEAAAVLAGDEREWIVPGAAEGALQSVQVRTSTGQVVRAESGG